MNAKLEVRGQSAKEDGKSPTKKEGGDLWVEPVSVRYGLRTEVFCTLEEERISSACVS